MRKIIIYIFILIFPITVYAKLEDNNFNDMKLNEIVDKKNSYIDREEFINHILYVREGNLTAYNKETGKISNTVDNSIDSYQFLRRYTKYNMFLYKSKCYLTDDYLKELYSFQIDGLINRNDSEEKYIFLIDSHHIFILNKEDSKKPIVFKYNTKNKLTSGYIRIDADNQIIVINARNDKEEYVEITINNKLEVKEINTGDTYIIKKIVVGDTDYVLTRKNFDFYISKYTNSELIKKVKATRNKPATPSSSHFNDADMIMYKGKIYINQRLVEHSTGYDYNGYNTLNLFDENLNELVVNDKGGESLGGSYFPYIGLRFAIENDKIYVYNDDHNRKYIIDPVTLDAQEVIRENNKTKMESNQKSGIILETGMNLVREVKLSENRIRLLCYNKTEDATYVREYNKNGEKVFERKLEGNVNNSGNFYGDFFYSITKDGYTIDTYVLNGIIYVDSYKESKLINSYKRNYINNKKRRDLSVFEMEFKKNGFYIIYKSRFLEEDEDEAEYYSLPPTPKESKDDKCLILDFTFNYEIKDKSEEQGFVNISNPNAIFGEIVTLSPANREGYEVDDIIVLDNEGNEIEVKDNKFTMPASNVEVKISYKKSTPNPETGDYIALITLLLLVSGYIGIKHYKNISC